VNAHDQCQTIVCAEAQTALDLTVWALRRRPDNVVDRWDGHTDRRLLPLPAGPMEVAVTQAGPPETPRLRIAVGDAAGCREVSRT
jgi:hypothetical protein